VEELPGPNCARFLSQGAGKKDGPENGESGSDTEKEVVAAPDRVLHQAIVYGRAHRGTDEVEPVALGPGGIGAASPGATGA
jgi:hypothetical protein